MIIYARFYCRLSNGTEKTKRIYEDFQRKMEKYKLDVGLYRIPIDTEECTYAERLDKEYGHKEGEECGKDGLKIILSEIYEKVYNKKDYKEAVAYRVWFLQSAYTYEAGPPEDVDEWCCKENKKNGKYNLIQVKPYYIPKREFMKKNCAQLDNNGYAVLKEVYEDLLQLGAVEEDFWPVYTKKKEVVCYQLMPQHKVSLREINNWKKKIVCPYCGYVNYEEDDRKPLYIDKKTLGKLKILNATEEMSAGAPMYLIINKETYEFLSSKYKRMNFEPIFLKE